MRLRPSGTVLVLVALVLPALLAPGAMAQSGGATGPAASDGAANAGHTERRCFFVVAGKDATVDSQGYWQAADVI